MVEVVVVELMSFLQVVGFGQVVEVEVVSFGQVVGFGCDHDQSADFDQVA